MPNSSKLKNISRDRVIDLYLVQNKSRAEVIKILGICKCSFTKLQKILNIPKKSYEAKNLIYEQHCLNKFGTTNYAKTQTFKKQLKEIMYNTYGVDNYSKTKEYKEKIKKAYDSGIPQQKRYRTQLKNNTLNIAISKEEDRIYELLLTKFDKEDIVRQYKSEVYPFKCDFYIRSLDLYIEYQGYVSHQSHAFNALSDEDQFQLQILIEKAKKSNYFDGLIRTWTERDPLKRKIAQENNLNFKEFFSLKELDNWVNTL